MQITERPPTPFALRWGTVDIATERWELEPWHGAPDPPDLQRTWSIKPKFIVDGRRSCAELAVVDHMRAKGWDGVWVSAFGGAWLRAEWFPRRSGPSLRLALRRGQRRFLSSFARPMAGGWAASSTSSPGESPTRSGFLEIKVAKDRIRPTQRKFVESALRFCRPDQFLIVEVPGL